MGNPHAKLDGKRYGVVGPQADRPAEEPAAPAPRAAASMAAAVAPAPTMAPMAAPAAAQPSKDQELDKSSAMGNLWGSAGDAFGAGGLGLSGIGEGGGGKGEGIGLGNIGTIGHGAGTGSGQGFGNGQGRLGGANATRPPQLQQVRVNVTGRLPPEIVQRIVRQNFGRFRLCYENGLRQNPVLEGRVSVRLVIDHSGSVASTQDSGSTLIDKSVVACVIRGFGNLSFPQPEGGQVTVVYDLRFTPGEGPLPPSPTPATDVKPAVGQVASRSLGVIGHAARPCGAAAELPLAERRTLWVERLAQQGGMADGALRVYRKALEDCEAPSWRERTTLLLAMVDSLPSVTARVALWKSLLLTPAADVVYRAIVVRVQTVADLHALHKALGLASVDPDLLAGMLAKAKTPADKLSVLRAAAIKWPDDFELALRVLDGFEDVGDDAGGRAWARRMRRRADATAHVWTSVGEYYLRLAARGKGADAEHD